MVMLDVGDVVGVGLERIPAGVGEVLQVLVGGVFGLGGVEGLGGVRTAPPEPACDLLDEARYWDRRDRRDRRIASWSASRSSCSSQCVQTSKG